MVPSTSRLAPNASRRRARAVTLTVMRPAIQRFAILLLALAGTSLDLSASTTCTAFAVQRTEASLEDVPVVVQPTLPAIDGRPLDAIVGGLRIVADELEVTDLLQKFLAAELDFTAQRLRLFKP